MAIYQVYEIIKGIYHEVLTTENEQKAIETVNQLKRAGKNALYEQIQ